VSDDIEISFLGGAKEVGRSSFIIISPKGNFLLDSGINLGGSEENKYPIESPEKPDAVFLSHSHLDHSGSIPVIINKYDCKLFATPPTQDITEILTSDSLKIAKETGESLPYSMNDVMSIRKKSIDARNKVRMKVKDDVFATFYNSGHIIGSSMIELKIGNKTIFYSGDLSTRHTRTLTMANDNVKGGDIIIMESTYGDLDDKHPSSQKTDREFIENINNTLKNGGKVIIPVFAVGRAQEVMLTLDDYMRSGSLVTVPIFIDGLIRKINEFYSLYWEWLRPEIQKRIRYTRQGPLESDTFYSVKDREIIAKLEEPYIIVTTSGMLEGGPAIFYLDKLAQEKKNLIYLTGYQVEGTRGRKLLDGAKELTLADGREINIECGIKFADFSAHADQPGLINFISKLKKKDLIFCVHGEESKTINLSKRLSQIKGVQSYSPSIGETIKI
jgi:predicted metal-dependent RNase